MKKFKFSVVIPIYNVEDYLDETIMSVINQSIGFEDNIQIILINDGSPDNSEEICLKYKNMYPDNIVYIKQKNSGVSFARNAGIKLATGELCTMLDSDDLWSEDSFKTIYKLYLKNPDINIFSCRMNFFDARKGGHQLNYKYKKNLIVDITKDVDYPQLSSSSTFIKTDVIKEYSYNSKIKFSEDTRFINEILLDVHKMMICKNPIYYYRKRLSGNSAIQTAQTNKDWYFVTPKDVYRYLFNLSLKKFGKIIPYIQNLIMYDLEWRLKIPVSKGILTKQEEKEYIDSIINLLKDIDDDIILMQHFLNFEYKTYALKLKYGNKFESKVKEKDNGLYFMDNKLLDFTNNNMLAINVMNLNDDNVSFFGQLNCCLENEYKLYYVLNGKKKRIDLNDSKRYLRCYLTGESITNKTFHFTVEIDYNKTNSIDFIFEYKNVEYPIIPSYTLHGRLHKTYNLHYIYKNRMAYRKKNTLIITKKKFVPSFTREVLFFAQLLKNLRLKQIIYRYTSILLRPFFKKDIWIVSDRTSVANDNGMHLFKYLSKINDKDINVYFTVSKDSSDYLKMKKYGKVLPYNSFKYKIYFLLANKIISSQGDSWVMNAFGSSERFYRDLYRFDFVFLQHGITKNDQTAWLNVYNKNIKMMVTATQPEYDSFLELDYGYDESVIRLTGFPRYDNLKNDSKKMIAVMPTWRHALAGKSTGINGGREYNPDFKNSDYFKFFNNFINDERVLNKMRDKGYTGIFVIHPSHVENYKDFKENDVFKVVHGFADYQQIFKEASLLISDYSSVMFDFAYLYKPVIYCPFDKEEFFASHIYSEGYFDDIRDGFGPVATNYEDLVKEFNTVFDNNFKLSDKYKKRIDKFYKYHDNNNCKRVYEDIKKI